jgi:hypothetical protein
MVAEVRRICNEQGKSLGDFAQQKYLRRWAGGTVPNSLQLAKLSLLGGDVIYVLTGKRSGQS